MRFLNQMGEDFGVGLGAEYVAALGEGLPQRSGVFDDAVVHHGEGAAAVRMGMGIDGVRGAVRRPARVRDRGRAFGQLTAKLALERGDLSGCAEYFEPAVDDGQTCRVVPAILETLQPLEHDRRRCPFADVPYDAAHNRRPSSINRSASARDGASAMSRMIGSVPEGRTCSQRSGHASRSPSCVSAAASGKRRRNSAYTWSSFPGSRLLAPSSSFALTIVYRCARATSSLTVTRSRSSSDNTNARATGASRPTCSAGYITPPFPSPPIAAFSAMIFRATCASPTAARTTRAPNSRAASSTTSDVDKL